MKPDIASFSLRHTFVRFPQAIAAIERMKTIHADSRRTGLGKGLAVLGPSGVGKSTVLRQFMSEMESERPDGMRVVYVEVPSSPSPKTLASAILAGLGDPFAYGGRDTAEEKLDRIVKLFAQLQTEVLILDEAQHMVERSKSVQISTADWLKRFMNTCKTVVILAGLQRTEELLQPNEQLRRRFSATFYFNRFDPDDPHGRRNFGGLLKVCQQQLPLAAISFTTPETALRFHYATFGLIDYLIKIVDRAVQLAAQQQCQEIDMNLLAAAFCDEVWSGAPPKRNPFHASFDLRQLTGPQEPFEGFDIKAAINLSPAA